MRPLEHEKQLEIPEVGQHNVSDTLQPQRNALPAAQRRETGLRMEPLRRVRNSFAAVAVAVIGAHGDLLRGEGILVREHHHVKVAGEQLAHLVFVFGPPVPEKHGGFSSLKSHRVRGSGAANRLQSIFAPTCAGQKIPCTKRSVAGRPRADQGAECSEIFFVKKARPF